MSASSLFTGSRAAGRGRPDSTSVPRMNGDDMDWAAVGRHLGRHGLQLLEGERPRFSGRVREPELPDRALDRAGGAAAAAAGSAAAGGARHGAGAPDPLASAGRPALRAAQPASVRGRGGDRGEVPDPRISRGDRGARDVAAGAVGRGGGAVGADAVDAGGDPCGDAGVGGAGRAWAAGGVSRPGGGGVAAAGRGGGGRGAAGGARRVAAGACGAGPARRRCCTTISSWTTSSSTRCRCGRARWWIGTRGRGATRCSTWRRCSATGPSPATRRRCMRCSRCRRRHRGS